FDAETSKGVVLVDFWAEWCGPCRMLSPVLDQLANEIGNKATIAKVDVDKAPSLAVKFSVRSIPALFILKEGKIVQQFVGVQDKKTLLSAIESAL
ncbi:MAG: thioredoxin, partial [Candidatus Nanoarchaeia archaeon]